MHEHHNQYMAEAEARHKSLTGVQASLEELKEIMTHFNKIFGCHVRQCITSLLVDCWVILILFLITGRIRG